MAGRGWALTQVTRRGGKEPFFGYSLRTPRWRYTEWDEGKEGMELYDYQADPNEFNNLAVDPKHAPKVKEMAALLRKSYTAVAGNASKAF